MKVQDHKKYALFNYEQNPSDSDIFTLGSVVINKENEIGVIIQCHGKDEYRTDMFGNCCYDDNYGNIEQASLVQIVEYRPQLFD